MDLTTNYMGLNLEHPLMPGASPLSDNLDTVRQLEDAGASAIVLHSLFEEQITGERLASIYHMEVYADSYAEALSYFPRGEDFALGKTEYLEHIRKVKQAVKVPVIASLNGTTSGGWIDYAKQMEQAGADGLELNVYFVATDPQETGAAVEKRLIDVSREVCKAVNIPVAVKLSPFFSSLPNVAWQLDEVGVDGLVLFNRFYQPDIDIAALEAKPSLHLSDSSELLLRLRWTAILSRQISANLALTGGVHTAEDVIKSVMAGAHTVQIVSCLLKEGPEYLTKLLVGVKAWMQEFGYQSMQQMRGSMGLSHCPDPQAFERANYMKTLQSWRASGGKTY